MEGRDLLLQRGLCVVCQHPAARGQQLVCPCAGHGSSGCDRRFHPECLALLPQAGLRTQCVRPRARARARGGGGEAGGGGAATAFRMCPAHYWCERLDAFWHAAAPCP
ncbi:hypothetical protein MNEG_16177 [Monoraphidium neglectum]|uniref:Uncharacterized protein n=1 Tax=Monoraphidium neglectum TaxID=145388 RepID=A0A0D2IV00_9CHLO|nr:hypothetical protein MNEG_16177 [Monoraphidium neglectum]KIY91787.1 hypothetical protein MNEG_16177 [Monoraphidium neglectum]|eukprot:XP_013890807.1 hypothetical protein MNEG_16177 [Monoraphidium neglectum]